MPRRHGLASNFGRRMQIQRDLKIIYSWSVDDSSAFFKESPSEDDGKLDVIGDADWDIEDENYSEDTASSSA